MSGMAGKQVGTTGHRRPSMRSAAGLAVVLSVVFAGPVCAQNPMANALGGFAGNSSAPIDIQADSLIINDTKKTATYKGNVVAAQGDYTLKTSELEVFYAGKDDGKAKGAKPTAQPADQDSQQIKKIKAKHKVVMTSAKDQTATGDEAEFNVADQRIVLVGNVYLKQGENVLTGQKLVVDLKTGESKFEAAPVTAAQAKSAPAAPAGSCPAGRVCTVLHPGKEGVTPGAGEDKLKKPNAPAAPAAKASESSAWSSTTSPPPRVKTTPQ